LNVSVDEHTAAVANELDSWNEYQQNLADVWPWLEKAEAFIAAGMTRPDSLEVAKRELSSLQAFCSEVDTMKSTINEASRKGDKIARVASVAEEVDALTSRWKAVKAASDQWRLKMQQLVDSWQALDSSREQMVQWLKEKEVQVSGSADVVDGNSLGDDLEAAKVLCAEAAKKQSQLVDLTKECDEVTPSLSLDSATALRGDVMDLKERLAHLNDAARQRVNDLSDALLSQQESQMKVDAFKAWLKDLVSRANALNEVPIDQIGSSLDLCHRLSQLHDDGSPTLAKLKKEIGANSNTKAGQSLTELETKFNELGTLLGDKKNALRRWSSFWTWHAESVANLDHIQKTVESSKTTATELEVASAELDHLAEQCQTRKIEASDDEQTAAKSKTYIIQAGKPMSILLLVADVLQRIVGMKDLVREREVNLQDVDEKWDEFR
jgi:hypothetical protein